MADNAIEAVDPASGAVAHAHRRPRGRAGGLKVDGDTLWVADVFAFRAVD
jgi:hypothetical protein